MSTLFVVENPNYWPLEIAGVDVVAARAYLTDASYAERRGVKVYNLCRYLGYQTIGYYVSLLAAARGHRPMPSVATIQDLRINQVVRVVSAEMEEQIQHALEPLKSDKFELSIYFGRNTAHRYDRIAKGFFDQFRAPLLRASFVRDKSRWDLRSLRAIAASEIPEPHRPFVVEAAQDFFIRPGHPARRTTYRYDLAILVDAEAVDRPSNDGALKRFVRAARDRGIDARIIGRDDYGRLSQFDALFIRETTSVNHHTYRFARRADAEGLVVIDDPESIVRCSNKVYQAELFAQRRIPTPRTMVVHEGNIDSVADEVGLPCVLKRPDAAFSRGVVKANNSEELRAHLTAFLAESELAIAQEFMRSDFDWRIGILGGEILYACRYHMVPGHWQIAQDGGRGRRYGRVEALPVDLVPKRVLSVARRAARLIGDGLYGVDLKSADGRVVVVEINDNPNIDHGCEDTNTGSAIYEAIIDWFLTRLDARGARGGRRR